MLKRSQSSILCAVLLLLTLSLTSCLKSPSSPIPTNRDLRQSALDFVRQSLMTEGSAPKLSMEPPKGPWTVTLKSYAPGQLVTSVQTRSAELGKALRQAVMGAQRAGLADPAAAQAARLVLQVSPKADTVIRAVEFHGSALEGLPSDRVAVRTIDQEMIRRKALDAKHYLLGIMDPVYGGFAKKYDALQDRTESRVRTIYSASALWTLLRLQDLEATPEMQAAINRVTDFLLSMQVSEGRHRGAFYYSKKIKTGIPQELLVVGTASKTIFTLLELRRRTGETRFLDAAVLAGDWLLSAQDEAGVVTSTYRLKDGVWIPSTRFSTLYHGQVLSAFSRLYTVTRDERYRAGASKLAAMLIKRAQDQNYFLRDDYRLSGDPVPTSWGVMSLFDYHRTTDDAEARDTLLKLAASLMDRQHKDQEDIFNLGRFEGSTASSGNGWINEVFSEVYLYGQKHGWDPEPLNQIRVSILQVTRWLIQNTYSEANTYAVKNPSRAIGGLIRNYSEAAVRTDAVCHGVNGYLNMLEEWPEGPLLDIPERS